MGRPPPSSLALALCLGLAACAQTLVTDHAVPLKGQAVEAGRLGRTLLVVELALPGGDKDLEARGAEASQVIRESLPVATGLIGQPDSDEHLFALARSSRLDSIMIIRVEEYARHGNLYVGLAVPPVSWDSNTTVSLRLRALDARTGAVIADLRRDRVRGGRFTNRTPADLPGELRETLGSLVVKG
jgi:hypothetical protein